MEELYLLNSILETPEVINDLYFLQPEHFKIHSKEFEFVKNRYIDTGEITRLELHLFQIKITSSDFTLDHNKIINISRHLFEEYHKNRILSELRVSKNDTLDDVIGKIKGMIDSVDDAFQKNKLEDTILDVIDPLLKKVNEMRTSGKPSGLTLSTLPTMNNIIGGIMPTDLIGIYGKEKSSKSSLALEMMLDLCIDQKIPGAIFSFEMDKELVAMKSISMRIKRSINDFRNPQSANISDAEFVNIAGEIGRRFFNTKLYVIDQVLDEFEIEAKIRKLLDKGIKIVLIDYLMLINARNNFTNTRDELNYLSKFFKRIAQKYKIAVILISQANDQGTREAEAKGLSRDSNYYFYVAKLEPKEETKVNGLTYFCGEEPEYIIKNIGIRHAIGGNYFFAKFFNNLYREIKVIKTDRAITKYYQDGEQEQLPI